MAAEERKEDSRMSGYSYSAMSNLVTRADRRFVAQADDATGEPDSLAGRISLSEMGSRARASEVNPREIVELDSIPTTSRAAERKRKRSREYAQLSSARNIYEATSSLEGLTYIPSTTENKTRLQALLLIFSQTLGSTSPDVVRSAADFAIETLKASTDEDQLMQSRKTIEEILGQELETATFERIAQCVASIDDYNTDGNAAGQDEDVAVILDDKDDEEFEDDDDVDEGQSSDAESMRDQDEDVPPTDDVDAGEGSLNIQPDSLALQVPDQDWLQRSITAHNANVDVAQIAEVLLSDSTDQRAEDSVMELLDFQHEELATLLLKRRNSFRRQANNPGAQDEQDTLDTPASIRDIDLEDYAFADGVHFMSNKKVSLPEGSFKRVFPTHEEIQVPVAKQAAQSANLVPITELPSWAQAAFPSHTTLNPIQSRIFPAAFHNRENLLLCAPTGAGKTNVAMLCILNELQRFRNDSTGEIALDDFKVVYIAPLKALVNEMMRNFSNRLQPYGIQVGELTGDSQLSRGQLARTNIIVTTPEKWDVVMRKANDASVTSLVGLMIIDEIHLLHDTRGPVLESIVARLKGSAETPRIVGLSATLPNYRDVATFIGADQDRGVYYFDSTFRPCPLHQTFVGVTEKKAIQRLQALNAICYDKALEAVKSGHQVLVFVHSRVDTFRTAKYIRDKAIADETIGEILRNDAATREILKQESETVSHAGLKEVLPFGLALHHAGLTKADRSISEDLFADGHARILVATATLAWGVNLPAHAVIIKGTQIYSPDAGAFIELSPQDVLQMLGRAGRPQYDTYGEGTILTNHAQLQYYLSLMNQQLPIESQLISKLPDMLNAEVVLGKIRTREEAVSWLGQTYLYVRMLAEPALYGVNQSDGDAGLHTQREEFVHAAAKMLADCHLVKYNVDTGRIQPTDLGRIASHYYLSHRSMRLYNKQLRANLTHIDLFRIFAQSDEFRNISIREDERLEVAKILERVPIPVRESMDEPLCKVNLLLQAYISRAKLDGFALVADMVYISQSAGRLLRAIFEICLHHRWAQATRLTLETCKMAERGQWQTRTPLAQYPNCPRDVLRRVERKDFPWSRYFELDPQEMFELLGDMNVARKVHAMVRQFPRLDVVVNMQPMTRSGFRMQLSITSLFEWDRELHGASQMFWIFVEDCDASRILAFDQFLLREADQAREHFVDLWLPCFEPVSPQYFVTITSNNWLHCENRVAVPLRDIVFPPRAPRGTALTATERLSTADPVVAKDIALFKGQLPFTLIETQAFELVARSSDSCFVASPNPASRRVLPTFALLQHFETDEAESVAVYLSPFRDELLQLHSAWKNHFEQRFTIRVGLLEEDRGRHLAIARSSQLILSTPLDWEHLSRRWQSRRFLHKVSLIIADHIDQIDSVSGTAYEIAMSRARYVSAQVDNKLRIVAFSTPVADGRDLADWLDIKPAHILNFRPSTREQAVNIRIQTLPVVSFQAQMLNFIRMATHELSEALADEQVILCVPHAAQCLQYAQACLQVSRAVKAEDDVKMEGVDEEKLPGHDVEVIMASSPATERAAISEAFKAGTVRTLIVEQSCVRTLDLRAPVVLLVGTQRYEPSQHRYVDYTSVELSNVLHLTGTSEFPSAAPAKVVIMSTVNKRDYLKRTLADPLDLESQLPSAIHDDMLAEMAGRVIESKQEAVDWITWSLFYRRLVSNPSYYGLDAATHDGVSNLLSDLVEDTTQQLAEAELLEATEDNELQLTNLGTIAAHYGVSYLTVQTFFLSFTARTRLKGLLEILCAATELDFFAVRPEEEKILEKIARTVPLKLEFEFDNPHHKAFILLQAHFSRYVLPSAMEMDMALLLPLMVTTLVPASVDVMATTGLGDLVVLTAELSQMLVQAVWDRDSPLKQVPHFDPDTVAKLKQAGVADVIQVAELDNDERTQLLADLTPPQMNDVARFCNGYPDIEMAVELVGESDEDAERIATVAGSSAQVRVSLQRNIDPEDVQGDPEGAYLRVTAPLYPLEKRESWWIVLVHSSGSEGSGGSGQKGLLALRRVTLAETLSIDLEFTAPAESTELSVLFISDAYAGTDLEQTLHLQVVPGGEEENDS
ncbi:Pre-mRNA-splicing helicase BRR2 [Savitreella phatthalungensis]